MLTATMPFDDSNFPKFMRQVEIGEYPEPLGISDGKDCLSISIRSRYNLDKGTSIFAYFRKGWSTKPCPKLSLSIMELSDKKTK